MIVLYQYSFKTSFESQKELRIMSCFSLKPLCLSVNHISNFRILIIISNFRILIIISRFLC